jgi:hypothetical protein
MDKIEDGEVIIISPFPFHLYYLMMYDGTTKKSG